MPYIKQADKPVVRANGPSTPGELNYVITHVVDVYLADKPISYATLNEIVGALELAKHEFIRRIVNPFEELKIHTNGDVYTPDTLEAYGAGSRLSSSSS